MKWRPIFFLLGITAISGCAENSKFNTKMEKSEVLLNDGGQDLQSSGRNVVDLLDDYFGDSNDPQLNGVFSDQFFAEGGKSEFGQVEAAKYYLSGLFAMMGVSIYDLLLDVILSTDPYLFVLQYKPLMSLRQSALRASFSKELKLVNAVAINNFGLVLCMNLKGIDDFETCCATSYLTENCTDPEYVTTNLAYRKPRYFKDLETVAALSCLENIISYDDPKVASPDLSGIDQEEDLASLMGWLEGLREGFCYETIFKDLE